MNPIKSFYSKHIANGHFREHWTAYALTFFVGYWAGGGCNGKARAETIIPEQAYQPSAIEQTIEYTPKESILLHSTLEQTGIEEKIACLE
ncbi:MAG: hypothetical protein V1743_05620 [Nanoarchaeota archaeon]